MAATSMTRTEHFIGKCVSLAADMVKLPTHHAWLDYDEEADVLYISFRKPQRATKTVETDDDVLVRKSGSDIVGLTILHASSRR